MNKAKINSKLYDVISMDEYINNKNLYNPSFTAIEQDGLLYPIRKKKDTNPGYYSGGVIGFFVPPNENELQEYDSSRTINFSDVKSVQDVIEKSSNLKKLEYDVLTTAGNIFEPKIKPNDSPAMIALKQAVTDKHIDISNYEYRFDGKYNNDIRIFNSNDITLFKLTKFADIFDLKCTLTLEDKNPDVPNPMKKTISVVLNDGDDHDE